MPKASNLNVDIDPELRDRLRKEANRIGIRFPSLITIALAQFLERADGAAALRAEMAQMVANQTILNAKIEHLAEFVAAALISEEAASSARPEVTHRQDQS